MGIVGCHSHPRITGLQQEEEMVHNAMEAHVVCAMGMVKHVFNSKDQFHKSWALSSYLILENNSAIAQDRK